MKRKPSAGKDLSRSLRSAATPSSRSNPAAAQAVGSARPSGRMDQADSSDESRSGSASRPSVRTNTAQAFKLRTSGGSGAKGFSSSKMPVRSDFSGPPSTPERIQKTAPRTRAAPA